MTTIAARLQAVHTRIRSAAQAAGRRPGELRLIAVSKTFPAESILEAIAAGQFAFGENYAQEALAKMNAVESALAGGARVGDRSRSPAQAAGTSLARRRDASPRAEDDAAPGDDIRHSSGVASPQAGPLLRPPDGRVAAPGPDDEESLGDARHSSEVASPQAGPLLRPPEWHFIGPIQSNKTRQIAEHFDWVHSVDREKIARRLSEARPANLPPLQVCLQVNVSGEASKSGVSPEAVPGLAEVVAALPGLRLRGLMAIPEPTEDSALQRRRFAQLRALRDTLNGRGFALDTLSMGMSDDLEAAIAEGATMVRIGRAIFGARRTAA